MKTAGGRCLTPFQPPRGEAEVSSIVVFLVGEWSSRPQALSERLWGWGTLVRPLTHCHLSFSSMGLAGDSGEEDGGDEGKGREGGRERGEPYVPLFLGMRESQ